MRARDSSRATAASAAAMGVSGGADAAAERKWRQAREVIAEKLAAWRRARDEEARRFETEHELLALECRRILGPRTERRAPARVTFLSARARGAAFAPWRSLYRP